MSKLRLNRRTFLRAAGAAAGGLALSSSPFMPRATAQATTPRFLFIYAGGGWTPRTTFMRPAFAPAEWGHHTDIIRIAANDRAFAPMGGLTPETTEFEFSFTDPALVRSDMSPVLDPFWDVRSKMMVFEGLAMLSTGWDSYGDAHAANHLAVATAAPAASEYDGVKSTASAPSIDQLVLEHIRQSDPLAYSFNFNPNVWRSSGTDGFHYFLYGNDGTGINRLPTDGDPSAVFRRVFGGLEVDPDAAAAAERAAAQQAVFDQLQRQYRDIGSRMSGRDAVRIDAHRHLLDMLARGISRPPITCDAPPMVDDVTGLSEEERYQGDWRNFANLIAAGFACDATRVASISLNGIPTRLYGVTSNDIHHQYEHPSEPTSLYASGDELAAALDGEEKMTWRNAYQAGLVADLVRQLDEIPEGDGTVLDNTIVLYVSELANGNHGSEFDPFVMFGGSHVFNTGRYLKYRQDNPNPWNRNYRNEYTGTPHSKLYVSILQALGLDIDYIHQPSIDGSVPHAGITGTIDMSGPLPRLV